MLRGGVGPVREGFREIGRRYLFHGPGESPVTMGDGRGVILARCSIPGEWAEFADPGDSESTNEVDRDDPVGGAPAFGR